MLRSGVDNQGFATEHPQQKPIRSPVINPDGSTDLPGSRVRPLPGGSSALHLDQLRTKERTPCFVYVLTFFSGIGGFLFGYDTGVISGAMLLLRDYFSLNSVWQELIVSVTVGTAAVFALLGGWLNDKIGRKPVILLASLVFTVGSFCLAFAMDRYMLLVGRIVVGAGVGLTSTTIPMYIAEAAPTNVRGRLVSTNVVMIAGGQFIANVVCGIFSSSTADGWRYMLGLGVAPAVIQFFGFLWLPESPRWLITQDDDDKARAVLQQIRGEADIDDEFDAIKQSCLEAEREIATRNHAPLLWQMLTTPSVRRALIIGCSLQMFQQVAGINTVMYYSATIVKMSGVKDGPTAIWLAALTALINFIFTCVGVYLVEKIGRRPLTIGSLLGAVISLVWLAIGFQVSSIHSPRISMLEQANQGSSCDMYETCNDCMRDLYCGYCYEETSYGVANASCLPSDYNHPMSATSGRCNSTNKPFMSVIWAYDYCPTPYAWMAMVGLSMYLFFFAPGMGPMPWTINSEIYPLWARSKGNSLSTFTNWVFNLTVSMSFLSLTESLTRYGTFWLYSVLALLGVLFFTFFLPETKGKSLEEVEGLFARPFCSSGDTSEKQPLTPFTEKNIQYVHIRGLNRDGRDSEIESPE